MALMEAIMAFTLLSPTFLDQGPMPTRSTAEGANQSPTLEWQNAPEGTKSFALIVDDPDAPDPSAPKMVFVHWVLFNIPANVSRLGEGVIHLPEGTREGLNDRQETGYTGPKPPIGQHRYFFKLYALDTTLDLAGTPTKPEVLKAMEGHVLAQATLMGTYYLQHACGCGSSCGCH
jgi:Raf kinase inhibitor-like YbhB/YbcL family protein